MRSLILYLFRTTKVLQIILIKIRSSGQELQFSQVLSTVLHHNIEKLSKYL